MKKLFLIIFIVSATSLAAKYNITSCSNPKSTIGLLYHWHSGFSPAKVKWTINNKVYDKPELYIKIIESRKNLEKYSNNDSEQITFYTIKMQFMVKETGVFYTDWLVCEEIKGTS